MNATVRFLRLLWIDFRRVHGYVPVLLVLGLSWFDRYGQYRQGIELWADADRRLFSTVLFLTAIGGGYGAWVSGRIRRRRLEAQEATLPAPAGRAMVISLVAAGCWMSAAYVIAAAWHYWPPLQHATWGGPNLALAIPVLGATWMAVGLGGLIGGIHRSLLIPPLVTAGMFALQIWGQVEVQNSRVFRLVPMGYLEDYQFRGELDGFMARSIGSYMVAMLAAALMAFAGMLLVSRVSIVRTGLLIAGLAVVVPAGQQVLAAKANHWDVEPYVSAVARECEIAPVSGIEVCLHPAFGQLMDDIVPIVDRVYGPVVGLEGVPHTINQPSDLNRPMSGGDVLDIALYGSDPEDLSLQFAFALFPPRDGDGPWTGPDPVECFVVTWLTGPDDSRGFGCDGDLSWVQGEVDFDIPTREAELQAVPSKVAAFEALTPAEQQAWLETNWDALRAGELTLEDLP